MCSSQKPDLWLIHSKADINIIVMAITSVWPTVQCAASKEIGKKEIIMLQKFSFT